MMPADFNADLDREVTKAIASVAQRMREIGLPGSQLRENKHLAPLTKEEVERHLGTPAVSRTLRTPAFPGLGPVDIVSDAGVLMELKWSYKKPNKIFESVWDVVKLAILGAEFEHEYLYVATGASTEDWNVTECADLFQTGTIDALEIWSRRLASGRGSNNGRTVCEDLVLGAWGNQPKDGPETLELRYLDSFRAADDFELRLVSVKPARQLVPWPKLDPLSGNALPWAACVDLEEVEIDRLLSLLAATRTKSSREKPADPVLTRLDDKLRGARPRS